MRNTDLISKNLESALEFLYKQEKELQPFLDILRKIIDKKLDENIISVNEAFNMYLRIQEQYTNSILLITKIKEIIDFKD